MDYETSFIARVRIPKQVKLKQFKQVFEDIDLKDEDIVLCKDNHNDFTGCLFIVYCL